MKKWLFLFVLLAVVQISCSDEDDKRDVNYELILGEWFPETIQVDLNQVYAWDYSCGADYLLIQNDSLGQYNLHFDSCSVVNNNSFTYKMENLFLYIQENTTSQPYRREILKLTAKELILSDPDDWRVNYIKYVKK